MIAKTGLKRLCAVLLALLTVCGLLPAGLLPAAAQGNMIVAIGQVSGEAGEEVLVPLTVSGNPGMAAFRFWIDYDSTKLTPLEVTAGEALPAGGYLEDNIKPGMTSPLTVLWLRPTNMTGNGTLVYLRLRLAADAAVGTHTLHLRCRADDIISEDRTLIPVTLQDGAVTVPLRQTGLTITGPDKTQYKEGEELDLTGLTVTAHYNDGSAREVSDYEVSGYDPTPGPKTVTISYGGFRDSFTVTVAARQPIGLEVTTPPDKLQYIEGQTFDPTGMVVSVLYDNDTKEPVTDYRCSELTGTAGAQTITISWKGLTTTLEVTVAAKTLQRIEIASLPDKQVYVEGQAWDPTGLQVKAVYDNGIEENITGYTVEGYDPTVGVKKMTVRWGGMSAHFEVEVVPRAPVSIAVTKKPNKQSYIEGQAFDPAGMVVAVLYNDGTEEAIGDYQIGGYDSTPGTKTITVTYGGFRTSFTVTVRSKQLASIAVTTPPRRTAFVEGTELDTAGMVVTLTYDNGNTQAITSGWTETADLSRVGQTQMTIAYGGLSTTYPITVTAKTLQRIAVTKLPSKTRYIQGEAFSSAGMAITAYYDNGATENVTDKVRITGYSGSTVGEQTITVAYEGKTAVFKVTVSAKSVASIAMKSNPSKTTYLAGEALDLTGAKITVRYNNNTAEDIAVTAAMVSGYNANQVGSQTVTVRYQGKTTTFKVTVNSRVPDGITSGTYAVSGGYISKIAAGASVSQLLNGINEKAYCKIYKGNAEVSGNTPAGTGMEIRLLDGSTVKARVTVVVTGDTNGDGNITITDMLAVKSHLLKKSTLSGAAGKAADTSGDKAISITDFIQIKAHILGKDKIQARAC